MPIAHVRGVNINYEVLGSTGPWVAPDLHHSWQRQDP
jgi:hypothetical protein